MAGCSGQRLERRACRPLLWVVVASQRTCPAVRSSVFRQCCVVTGSHHTRGSKSKSVNGSFAPPQAAFAH
eukprot:162811-Chlamydomonas_euryale.AAC.2